jgi:hypothetical protein
MDLAEELEAVYQQYPALREGKFQARRAEGEGQLEFFPPDEAFNPMPGVPLIEVYNPEFEGEALQKALFGDALHYMHRVNPKFNELREAFRSSLTPQQKEASHRRHDWYAQNWGEERSYDQWFDVSDLDAHIRGYLAPDERDEWRDIYTDKQKFILEAMKAELKGQGGFR